MDKQIIIPLHLWFIVFKYVDIITLSYMSCLNKSFNVYIHNNKWDIIDYMIYSGKFIPSNRLTYLNYKYCIDWNSLIFYKTNIPDDVIQNVLSFDHIQLLFSYKKVSEKILRRYFYFINWRSLLFNQILPIDLLEKIVINYNLYSSDWKMLWKYQPNITIQFIEKYYENIDWESISSNKKLSLDIVDKYQNQIIWSEFTKQGIHEYILLKYIEKLDSTSWIHISWYSKLSHFFIKTFIKFLDKYIILHSQKVPDDILEYILETCDDGDKSEYWKIVAKYQTLSYNFINKYKQYLNMHILISNKHILKVDLSKIYN